MTWASLVTRSAGWLVLLPLVLTRLDSQEVAVFLLFSVMTGLRNLADFGFGPTFIRYIAYCMGGARSLGNITKPHRERGDGRPNLELLSEVVGSMRQLHRWVALAVLGLFAIVGSIAVDRQINLLADPGEGWLAWTAVVIGIVFTYWANQFAAYVQGLNHVALLRRWEALFNALGIASSIAVLLMGGGLVGLVVTVQLWLILSGVRNWLLARRVFDGWWTGAPRHGSGATLAETWAPAWRTGLGSAMSMGVVQLSGVLYAQRIGGEELAALLLALRLIAVVSAFSQAPFYSKLPLYARLYSSGDYSSLVRFAGRGMQLSYAAFLLGWIGLGLAGPRLFDAIGASTPFPPSRLWTLIGLAFLVHRFGAMHIQLYNATNHVIMHIADGVSGGMFVVSVLALSPRFGVLAIPLSQLIAYVGFYNWYSAMHSYRLIQVGFFRFERVAALPALGFALLYVGLAFGL